jgi:hypothetical protein
MKSYEHEQVGGGIGYARAIRRDDAAVLTCAACGCRLTARESVRDSGAYGPDAAWRHFAGSAGRDARGCRLDCVDQPHRTVAIEPS